MIEAQEQDIRQTQKQIMERDEMISKAKSRKAEADESYSKKDKYNSRNTTAVSDEQDSMIKNSEIAKPNSSSHYTKTTVINAGQGADSKYSKDEKVKSEPACKACNIW
jgi:hypothetical protein